MTKQEAVGLFVLGIMLGAAAIVLIGQWAGDVFNTRRKGRDDLDWVWGLDDGLVSLDTATVWRRASRLVSQERRGASSAVLLHELDGLEAAMADVGARLLGLPAEGESDALITERLERYSAEPTHAVAS